MDAETKAYIDAKFNELRQDIWGDLRRPMTKEESKEWEMKTLGLTEAEWLRSRIPVPDNFEEWDKIRSMPDDEVIATFGKAHF